VQSVEDIPNVFSVPDLRTVALLFNPMTMPGGGTFYLQAGFEIDDELELRRLLDWNVGRVRTIENLT
jgi:hypothetical protein